MLLPKALSLGIGFTPVSPAATLLSPPEQAPVTTSLAFTPTAPIPLTYAINSPEITKGLSRAEEAVQETKKTQVITQKAIAVSSPVSAPTSTVVSEPGLEEKRALVQQIADSHGIDWRLLEAVWQIESGKSWKTSVRSSAGAQGPMQFMVGTWKHYSSGGDITYAPDALNAGAALLAANGAASGNIHQALFAYNHAEWYVNKVQSIMSSI